MTSAGRSQEPGQRPPLQAADCPLCAGDGGDVLWRDDLLRVILVDEPDYPGFTRVVWASHVAEMTDLPAADRARLLEFVWRVERVQRDVLGPDKINLASLGNVVAHLHWHVIPRWRDDRHFPQPVWGVAAPGRETVSQRRRRAVAALLPAYRDALRAACAAR